MKRRFLDLVLLAVVAALPASAATPIVSGTDLWVTPADGSTFSDFAANPIPSSFFCSGSAAFTGRIAFKGAPLASDEPEMLRTSDTVIHRLDDAAFDRTGVATTRLQVKAINLVSLQPLHTACGDFNVRATLAGDQPITRMRIYLDSESGGHYLAPLGLNVKLTFSPVNGQGRALSLVQAIRFPANPQAPWVQVRKAKLVSARYMKIDTDGDGRPDTLVPGPSNFRPLGTALGEKLLAQECLLEATPAEPLVVRSTVQKVVTTCEQAHVTPGHTHYVAPPPPPPTTTCDTSFSRFVLEPACP
jgi:hypothetical protein